MSTRKRRSPTPEERADAFFCKLLTAVCFSLLSPAEQREALVTAHEFGAAFADEWADEPDRQAYVDTCINFCVERDLHAGEIERGLWEQAAGLSTDPRLAAFAAGCYARRAELED